MTIITTESHISPQFFTRMCSMKLSSDVSRVAARCGLQREDWGGGCSRPKNTTKTWRRGLSSFCRSDFEEVPQKNNRPARTFFLIFSPHRAAEAVI